MENNLFEADKHILDALLSLETQPAANPEEADEVIKAGDEMPPTAQNLQKRANYIQQATFGERAEALDLTAGFAHLVDGGFIQRQDDTYQLMDSGRIQARHARLKRIGKRYSSYLMRAAESAAHATFCRRVFGKNLCQANMMDMGQLEILLDALCLSTDNKVLDLACGMGEIAEYISNTTGAHVVGVDIAQEALMVAQERTRQKRGRLEFLYGDLNDLDFPPASFDAIVAIAAVHFADDLDETLRQLKNFLTPEGQIGIFTFQYASDSDDADALLPEYTDLARALQKNSFDFQTWDFTEREIEIRRKQLQEAKNLLGDFQAEGNLDLIEDRIEECEIDLPYLEAGLKRRYLYHAKR
jgi:SAM-dependent methyltransferase